MTQRPKPTPSSNEVLCFFLCGSIGSLALLRNALRMHRYHKAFKGMMHSLQRFRHNFGQVERLKDSSEKTKAFLEGVFPNFPSGYFKNTEDPQKYSTKIGRFYEDLQCSAGFEGTLRHKGREYPIFFEMASPSVGFELAHNALKFDSQGIKFHRNQMIAAYGTLCYSKEGRRFRMRTEVLGLDAIEIQKFSELRLIATIISTFYFSILIGVSLSLACNLGVAQLLSDRMEEASAWVKSQCP